MELVLRIQHFSCNVLNWNHVFMNADTINNQLWFFISPTPRLQAGETFLRNTDFGL